MLAYQPDGARDFDRETSGQAGSYRGIERLRIAQVGARFVAEGDLIHLRPRSLRTSSQG